MKRFFLAIIFALALSPLAAFVGSGVALADDHPVLCNDKTVQYYTTGPTGSTTAAQACSAHKGVAKDQSNVTALAAAQQQAAVNAAIAATNPNCVKLSIPIFAGSGCIDNTAPGGAIVAYLKQILKLLSLAIGAVIMLMFVVAGIQYITSTGQPDMIKKAKTRIMNAVTALILFLMAYAIINFLIPGGLFS